MTNFENVLRIVAAVLLGVSLGALGRFYWENRRMSLWVSGAIGCWAVALMSTEVDNLNHSFRWFETPFVIAGSVMVLVSTWPYLKFDIRKGHDG